MGKHYLIVVESPKKISSLIGYLKSIGSDNFTVKASMGHIVTFKNGLKSIDIKDGFTPKYSIIPTKSKTVNELKSAMKSCDELIIATDPDREGEAIGYHIATQLGCNPWTTKRLKFHAITKSEVVKAFNSPELLDKNLVEAQQTRSILDLLVGFELSPILWRYISGGLSAGRCQSPALRLIAEREREIQKQKVETYFELSANFEIKNGVKIQGYVEKEYHDFDEFADIMETAENYQYKVKVKNIKTHTSNPPPPYETSSIQQDCSTMLGLDPPRTMSILQKLYEGGKITYMRTDSTTISKEGHTMTEDFIKEKFGEKDYKFREYQTSDETAQEAHECIRPTDLNDTDIDGTPMEKKVYKLIHNRIVASQMIPSLEDHYTIEISTKLSSEIPVFISVLKKTRELGYKRAFGNDLIDETKAYQELLEKPTLFTLELTEIFGTNKMKRVIGRYTQASLIKELKNKGIGRPSTFASFAETLIEKKYVEVDSRSGEEIMQSNYEKVKGGDITLEEKPTKTQNENKKLFITPMGMKVVEFLEKNFGNIVDYDYTKKIEQKLDKIAKGQLIWRTIIGELYSGFHPMVEELMSGYKEIVQKYKDGDAVVKLGKHPKTKKDVIVYPYKTGFIIQEGEGEEKRSVLVEDFPDIESITMDIAVERIIYPRVVGKYKDKDVILKKGPYGVYGNYDGKNLKVDKEILELSDSEILVIMVEEIEKNANRIIKEFTGLGIYNGPYGPYIRKGKKIVGVPKEKDPSKLTKKECEEIIANDVPKWKKFSKKPKTGETPTETTGTMEVKPKKPKMKIKIGKKE